MDDVGEGYLREGFLLVDDVTTLVWFGFSSLFVFCLLSFLFLLYVSTYQDVHPCVIVVVAM